MDHRVMRISPDKVSFGYRTVGEEEKKKLVHDAFTPIAGTYDRGLREIFRVLRPGGRLAQAGFVDVAFRPLTLGITVVYFGRKPQEVPHAADRQ